MASFAPRVLALAVLLLAAVIAVLLWVNSGPGQEPVEAKGWKIGLISNNPNGLSNVHGFQEGLRTLGFGEDDNVAFLYSGSATPHDELEAEIAQMIEDGADLIFTAGTPTGVAAHSATKDSGIPVIFGVIADPVSAGVMADLNQPGGNMTGVMLSQNQARRLQLLHTMLPGAKRILLPYNPNDSAPVSAARQLDATATALGLNLIHAHAGNDMEVSALLAGITDDIDAIFMLPDSTVNRRVGDLLRVANARGLPVSGPSTAQVEDGATMAYGIVHHEVGQQAAEIAVRVLDGADPAKIPVETADYYLTVNVAAADRIGLHLPETVLQLADRIVRTDEFEE